MTNNPLGIAAEDLSSRCCRIQMGDNTRLQMPLRQAGNLSHGGAAIPTALDLVLDRSNEAVTTQPVRVRIAKVIDRLLQRRHGLARNQ